MKIISLLVLISFYGMMCIAQQYVTLKTPTNVSIESINTYDSGDWVETWEEEAAEWIDEHNSDAVRIGPATLTYNCHCFAWHSSDGGVENWINQDDRYYNSNVSKYWTGGNATYTSTTLEDATKVYFPDGDHSQIISPTHSGWYESKWGWWPLYRHYLYDHPFDPFTNMAGYKLDVTGDDFLCMSAQDTYSTLNISGATYSWSAVKLTTSGSAYSTIGTASSNGPGSVQVSIESPYSNTTIHGTTPVWVGPPQITNQKVDGGSYYPGKQICPGDHYLNVTPVGGDAGTATWTVPYGITYFVGTNILDFTFPSNANSVAITTRSTNSCGTGTNSSFYLTKKTWGCYDSYAMTLSPNPASDYVTITMLENQPLIDYTESGNTTVDVDAKAYEPTTYTINIYNNQSTKLSSVIRSGKSFNVPIINLLDGTYTIEVSDGRNSYRQQLIVKHN